MKKIYYAKKTRTFLLLTIITVPLFMTACSSFFERGEPLVAADEMKEGPGVFSGQKGGFYLVGGEEKVASVTPVSKMNYDETSKILDNKIEQLRNDQKELEELKRQLNKKLQN